MSEVLIDLYTVFSFEKIFDSKVRNIDFQSYNKSFSLIENLVLCDKLVLEENGVAYHRLRKVCGEFADSFRYIQNKRLYDKTNFDNTEMVGGDIDKRGLVYADVAKENDIYYSPHPDRERTLSEKLIKYVDHTASSVIEQFDQKFNESKSGVISNVNVKIPPVVEHVLYFAKAQNISISDSVNEIRASQNATRFRQYFNDIDNELRNLSPRKKIPVYQKLFSEIDALCNIWVEDMDMEVRFRRRKINFTKIPLVGKILESIGVSEITVSDPIIKPDAPHFLFINELYQK